MSVHFEQGTGAIKLVGQALLMAVLLALSAFFSGSETAFFNLSRRQKQQFRKSGHALQELAAHISDQPRPLLGCLLLGNMTVNVLFFASASVFTVAIERVWGLTAAAVTAFACFLVLVLFGEILPKSLAYVNVRAASVAAALPLAILLKVLGPVQSVFRLLVAEPAVRLLLGPAGPARPMTSSEFLSLVEHARKRGHITDDETRLLGEIVQFGSLKVRHVMLPRVDMITCAVSDPPSKARAMMLDSDVTKMPVYARGIDDIVGLVYLRQLLLRPDVPLDKLVQKVFFVPEQAAVEFLLGFFRRTGTDTAVVVDEYGGIAGLVRLEDLAGELLGPVEPGGRDVQVVQLGPLEYRLPGDLPIHDLADTFGLTSGVFRVCTLGGMVAALLGRIPRPGDTARLRNLKFTVESVVKRRVESLILTLEPIQGD